MRKWDASHKTKGQRSLAIQRLLSEGKSVEEVATALKEDKTMVNYWFKRMFNEVPQQEDDS